MKITVVHQMKMHSGRASGRQQESGQKVLTLQICITWISMSLVLLCEMTLIHNMEKLDSIIHRGTVHLEKQSTTIICFVLPVVQAVLLPTLWTCMRTNALTFCAKKVCHSHFCAGTVVKFVIFGTSDVVFCHTH